MAEDLLDTIGQLFGPMRGGLALAVIFVGALLAATTGVVAASVISMGLISLPIMLRYGYDRASPAGVIAASGTLAQIIPPSLVLIVLADQLGRSVGDMYKGAFIPGFCADGPVCAVRRMLASSSPQWVPALPAEARTIREDNGASGLLSLLVLTMHLHRVAVALGQEHEAGHSWWKGTAVVTGATDETIVVAMCVACMLAFGDRRHQQGHAPGPAVAHGRARDVRADPAAAADLPGAGHHLPGHRHAHRRRRHGRAGRH
jgi:TRAP-type mannitol/chloroaromatic compound transport system permease large subunit